MKKSAILFSPKQSFVYKWWGSKKYCGYDGMICDGAVRSGKTTCMSRSFVLWAMSGFNGENFGLCGKTIVSLRRNLLNELMPFFDMTGMQVSEKLTKNYLDVSFGRHTNRFYLFGGKDEGSASMIQGITLAGVLLDEAVLMPRSFLEQAVARCSVNGSKIWINCNPDNPYHYLKREWIDKASEKNLIYLHFDLADNPSLTKEVIERYKRLYSGAFYERFVLGRWTAAEGLVYPMFDSHKHTFAGAPQGDFEKYVVSCDYGTVNPSSFGLWGKLGDKWYRLSEYYFDSAREGTRRTDEEHYGGLCSLIDGRDIDYVVCDPSAASFIQCIMRHGRYRVKQARNDVVSGIRKVQDFIREDRLLISESCTDILREFTLYRWDEDAGKDCPIKEHDHAMDDMRYFVTSLEDEHTGFTALSLDR